MKSFYEIIIKHWIMGKHEPTSFYSDFYECQFYQCKICGWPLWDMNKPSRSGNGESE